MNFLMDITNNFMNEITNLSYIFPAIGTGVTLSAPIAVMKLSDALKKRREYKDSYFKVSLYFL